MKRKEEKEKEEGEEGEDIGTCPRQYTRETWVCEPLRSPTSAPPYARHALNSSS
jgi:hypothetical protein